MCETWVEHEEETGETWRQRMHQGEAAEAERKKVRETEYTGEDTEKRQ